MMNRTLRAATVLALFPILAACGGNEPVGDASDPSPSATATAGVDGQIIVEYNAAAPEHEATQVFVEENAIFDDIVQTLNDGLILPNDIIVNVGGDPEGPYYDPSTGAIEYPYEFMDLSYGMIVQADIDEDPEGTAIGALRFVFIHELGHALVDQLDIPVLGKEEDAVDGLATVVLTELIENGAVDAISGAQLFYAFNEARGADQFSDFATFADEHSLDLQRFFSILCLIAGANEENYNAIGGAGLVPEDRLVRCPAESEQATTSWGKVLEPYLA